jgi:hypothetical protein
VEGRHKLKSKMWLETEAEKKKGRGKRRFLSERNSEYEK